MGKSETRIGILSGVLALVTGWQGVATVVPRLEFDDLVQRSARIVHARCIAAEPFFEPRDNGIWTRFTFEIIDSLQGPSTTSLVVTEPGGVLGQGGQWVPGAPHFRPGDESVLFLYLTPLGSWRVCGWGQGNYRVRREPSGGPVLVQPDLAGALLVDVIGVPPAVTSPRAVHTLEAFKERIRARLRTPGQR